MKGKIYSLVLSVALAFIATSAIAQSQAVSEDAAARAKIEAYQAAEKARLEASDPVLVAQKQEQQKLQMENEKEKAKLKSALEAVKADYELGISQKTMSENQASEYREKIARIENMIKALESPGTPSVK